jgi:hypothetical protein
VSRLALIDRAWLGETDRGLGSAESYAPGLTVRSTLTACPQVVARLAKDTMRYLLMFVVVVAMVAIVALVIRLADEMTAHSSSRLMAVNSRSDRSRQS